MFLIFGIDSKRKDLPYGKVMICSVCQKYGRYEIYMTYTCFSLFFIPIFRWNKTYFVKTSCCNSLYILDPAIGKAIEKGHDLDIYEDQLTRVNENQEWGYQSTQYHRFIQCTSCNYKAQSDAIFCPRCGRKL